MQLICSRLLISGILMLLITGTVHIAGCKKDEGAAEMQKANVLRTVEIRQYEGKNLSSTDDFRENSIKGPQYIDKKTYRLRITGFVDSPKTYTYDEVIDSRPSYKKVVKLDCVEGWSVTILWEGVLIKDLLKEANPSSKAKIVIFRSYEGYSTSFPIDYIMKNDILMAYKMNDVVIPPERGFPFELLAESKWGYKWIKWITEIELSADVNYKGYWERRGFSNSDDLNRNFFDDGTQ